MLISVWSNFVGDLDNPTGGLISPLELNNIDGLLIQRDAGNSIDKSLDLLLVDLLVEFRFLGPSGSGCHFEP